MSDSERHGKVWESARLWLSSYTTEPVDFLPDTIVESLRPEVVRSAWTRIPGFGESDDSVVWEFVSKQLPVGTSGLVIVVTDHSFSEGAEPDQLELDEVAELASSFVEEYSDEMFGGDCLLLHPDVMALVHHEGLLCIVTRRRSAGV